MPSSGGKSMKLHFKGDKPEKKKKKRSHGSSHGDGSNGKSKRKSGNDDGDEESDVEDVGGDEQSWVPVEQATDLSGPCLLFQPASSSSSSSASSFSTRQAYILSLNTTMSRLDLVPHTVSPSNNLSALDAEELEGAQIVESEASSSNPFTHLTPQDVNQVVVSSRVLDTYNPPRYTFRTIENRYIGSDKFGSVHCASEARGPQEEWALYSHPRGVLIQSHAHGGYLTLDEVAGGRRILRVDQKETIGGEAKTEAVKAEDEAHDGAGSSLQVDDAMVWSLKVQWKFRHEARKNARVREIGKGGLAGMEKRLKMQDSSAASSSMYKGEAIKMDKALKRAAREGRMAEEMLDRRAKAKGDKFC